MTKKRRPQPGPRNKYGAAADPIERLLECQLEVHADCMAAYPGETCRERRIDDQVHRKFQRELDDYRARRAA